MTDGMVGRLGEAPDLMEPVLGFRGFLLQKDGRLTSPHFTGVEWKTPQMRAECRSDNQSLHPMAMIGRKFNSTPCAFAPSHDHECGIYAYYDVDVALARTQASLHAGKVLGIVTLSGRIEVHETGMRAELCEIKALALVAHDSLDALWQFRVFNEAVERLDVLPLDPKIVAGTGFEYAAPMPVELRPKREIETP